MTSSVLYRPFPLFPCRDFSIPKKIDVEIRIRLRR